MTRRSIMAQPLLPAAALTLALSAAALPARAADDGYQNVFSSVLTAVGVLKPDAAPEIDYRERAPLVLPPKMDLAKPVEAGGARSANWPQDPDVVRRRKANLEAKAPVASMFDKSNEGDRALSKDELMKGRVAKGAESNIDPNDCSSFGNDYRCYRLSPAQLKEQGERFEANNPDHPKDIVKAGEEPEREYLTQPPAGYRRATKTVEATHEAPVQKTDAANPQAFLREQINHQPSDE